MKKQYTLQGLCCAGCAAKIQKGLLALNTVENASINMDTTLLSLEFEGDSETMLKDIIEIAMSIDEDITVVES